MTAAFISPWETLQRVLFQMMLVLFLPTLQTVKAIAINDLLSVRNEGAIYMLITWRIRAGHLLLVGQFGTCEIRVLISIGAGSTINKHD